MSFNSQTSPNAHSQLVNLPATCAAASLLYLKVAKLLQWYNLRENT